MFGLGQKPQPPPDPCEGCQQRDALLTRQTIALEHLVTLLPAVVGGLGNVREAVEIHRQRMDRIDGCLDGFEAFAIRAAEQYQESVPPYPEWRGDRPMNGVRR